MRRLLIRITTLSLTLVALAAPAAVARPAVDPPAPVRHAAESGFDWTTFGTFAGVALLAFAALACVAAVHLRRTHATA
jgi:hypothetical protein